MPYADSHNPSQCPITNDGMHRSNRPFTGLTVETNSAGKSLAQARIKICQSVPNTQLFYGIFAHSTFGSDAGARSINEFFRYLLNVSTG